MPDKFEDFTSYAGYAVSGVGILFLFYERFLWRIIPWNRPPVLKKKYNGNLKYKYLLCKTGRSFDSKGEHVMSHGSITIDEVIVPFITIKAGKNNG